MPECWTHPDSAHGDPKQRSHRQKLLIRIAETRSQLEDGDQQQVDDQGPFPAVSIGGDSEDDGTD